MERMTISDKEIDGGLERTAVYTKEIIERVTGLYLALKEYEDTGLTAEQVEKMKHRCIAKKPRIGDYHYLCTNCGCIRSIRQKHKFCHDCGQELKWED